MCESSTLSAPLPRPIFRSYFIWEMKTEIEEKHYHYHPFKVELWKDLKKEVNDLMSSDDKMYKSTFPTNGAARPWFYNKDHLCSCLNVQIFTKLYNAMIVKEHETIRSGTPFIPPYFPEVIQPDGFFGMWRNDPLFKHIAELYMVFVYSKPLSHKMVLALKNGSVQECEPLQKLIDCMNAYKVSYGVLCTYYTFWFCTIDVIGTLYISDAVQHDDEKPSVLEYFAYCVHKSRSKPSRGKTEIRSGPNGQDIFPIVSPVGSVSNIAWVMWGDLYLALKQNSFSCPQMRKKMENEIVIYKKLEGLQGKCIPRLVYYWIDSCCGTIGTELVGENIDLATLNKSEKVEIIEALMEIHSKGVLHGAISCRNILRGREKYFFIDFQYSKMECSSEEKHDEMKKLFELLNISVCSNCIKLFDKYCFQL